MDNAVTEQELARLKELIKETKALRDDERQYWLDLLPTLNDQQVQQLESILTTENENMNQIEQRYDQKLEAVGEKYLNRWDSEKHQAMRMKRQKEEQEHLEEAQKKAEDLLSQW